MNEYNRCCDACLRYEECRVEDEKLHEYTLIRNLTRVCDHFVDKNDKYWKTRYELQDMKLY